MAEPSQTTQQIQVWIDRLQTGDAEARDALLNCAADRLSLLAHKMLKSFPRVRRWEETGDVLQNALLRLHRTLKDVTPATAKDFFRLAALNVRRELLDLAKHYYGPQGAGAHHISQAKEDEGDAPVGQHEAVDVTHDPDRLSAWSEFHQQIEALPEEEREVFDLLWYQGLTQAEAADLLNVSERTIKRRWQTARLQLHDALKGELPE
jgi:RNA polymerase sigma-70 factor (ECF subfamily)